MEVILVALAVIALGTTAATLRRKKAPLELDPDVIQGQQEGLDHRLRWGESQEVVEQSGYQGNQYRTWTEVQPRSFVEVQAILAGRPLRINSLPAPQHSLARALDGADVLITDDRVRISWPDGRKDLDEQRRRALLLFVVLRYTGPEFLKQIEGLVQRLHRTYVLGHALTHLHMVPGIEAVARHVTPSDMPELRLAAALLLDRAEEALDLALHEDRAPALRLRAVDAFGERDPTRADRVLQRMLLQPDERRGVLDRIRALPLERAVAVLEPVCENPDTDALPVLTELAPAVALPHIRAVAHEKSNPDARLRAARLLHPMDAEAAEAVLIDLLDWRGHAAAVAELGRLGSERAVQPLLAIINDKYSEEVREVAIASLAEVRGRLASRPAGALALSDRSVGGLAETVGGLTVKDNDV